MKIEEAIKQLRSANNFSEQCTDEAIDLVCHEARMMQIVRTLVAQFDGTLIESYKGFDGTGSLYTVETAKELANGIYERFEATTLDECLTKWWEAQK